MTYYRKWRVINPGQVGSIISGGLLLVLLTGEEQVVEATDEAHAINLSRTGHFELVEDSGVQQAAESTPEPAPTVVPAEQVPQPEVVQIPAPDSEGAAQ
ncbi:hypothetical protein EHF33_20700 (plasmid) [Deinococcus psychrotolerans]|uniref:Uncharacterized protein n=1 Tax=Deinococcus psychrotolerans TaxID=2489213 RepID=A0A3G8YJB0_9DEIO|nr:hypothetical protein [Deinococcus psychrotolerans]AZI45332.1 hypothetical protein EHF33_20700 [Deinococcus psychrotolerans]